MKRIHLSTTIGLVLLLTGYLFFYFGFSLVMALLSIVAYFAAMKDVSKYTSVYQFAVVFAAALSLGFAIDYPYTAPPLLTLSIFLSACCSLTRIMFFRSFGYTGHIWFEPMMFTLTLVTYVGGDIVSDHEWQEWVLPLPNLVFAGILAYGILKDKRQLLASTKGGYKVEIGKEATDFELPDQDGNLVHLSDYKGKRHVLLVFVRGDWCPGCHMMLRTYEKNREKFQEKNVLVMAIGPDPVGVNREMVGKLGLDYKVLSDEGQKTAMIYGVQISEYDNAFAEKYEEGIPLPASFLVDIKGVVRYVSRPDKVGEFLNPSLIFPILDKLN
ncbi:MAG: redoxin domain-containing protein [Bacteroidia bacterium]